MSPLIEDLLGFGMTALPPALQGDGGLDVMAYWDGLDRTPKQWKSLRLEVGVAIEGLASDPQWRTVFRGVRRAPFALDSCSCAFIGIEPDSEAPTRPVRDQRCAGGMLRPWRTGPTGAV